MSYSEYYPAEDPFEEQPVKKKKPARKRPQRCTRCHRTIEPDGYGDFVHSGTDEWPAAYYGCQYEDDYGNPVFLRPSDPRFSHVATLR